MTWHPAPRLSYAGGVLMGAGAIALIAWAAWPMNRATITPTALPGDVVQVAEPPPVAAPPFPPLASYRSIWERFDKPGGQADAMAPQDLPLRLIATAVESATPYAVFINRQSGRTEVWRVGQSVDAIRLVDVQVDRVEFEAAGRRWKQAVPEDFRQGP